MSDDTHRPDDGSQLRTPNTPWHERVVYSPRAGGYARRPGLLLCLREDAYRRAFSLVHPGMVQISDLPAVGCEDEKVHPLEFDEAATGWSVESVVDALAEENLPSEPNYVLFANPMYANPMYANPVFANPMYANAYVCDGVRPTTARPAPKPDRTWTRYKDPKHPDASVVIFDTGIAAHKFRQPHRKTIDFCPKMLTALSKEHPDEWEIPDNDPHAKTGHGFVDPVSGHGTFIAGIVQSLAPGTKIVPRSIVSSYGDVDVLTVMDEVVELCERDVLGPRHIVNMSFGGYADEKMSTLQRAVRCIRQTGAVVVASAGNDATDRPTFPACISDVVGVGALDPYGPAPYSNHGGWVNACAPGTDLVSAFFRNFDGKTELPPMPGSVDPDHYKSWVRWTGTSFAAPIVTSALVREMQLTRCDAETAVERIVDAPGLLRIAGLGTVVNLDLGDSTCLMPGVRA